MANNTPSAQLECLCSEGEYCDVCMTPERQESWRKLMAGPPAAAVKERPILFSAPMVRALLAGRKTQTRRIMKPVREVPEALAWVPERGHVSLPEDGYWAARVPSEFPGTWHTGRAKCPYGVPGDRLWVRETWTGTWNDTAVHLHYAADGTERMAGEAPTEYVLPKAAAKVGGWVTPLFMPRWASRITLAITGVRVQRLKEISEEDADAEGVRWGSNQPGECRTVARGAFMDLWESINGKGSWDANPWVWALTFKRVIT